MSDKSRFKTDLIAISALSLHQGECRPHCTKDMRMTGADPYLFHVDKA